MIDKPALDPTIHWLKRIGVILGVAAAGAILAYALDLILGLFAFNTQVVVGIVLVLLMVAGILWWTASALFGAVDDIRAAQDDIAEQRAEGQELLSYARELVELSQEQLHILEELAEAERADRAAAPTNAMQAITPELLIAATTVMPSAKLHTDTDEAPKTEIAGGARIPLAAKAEATLDKDVEAWARAEVAKMWSSTTTTTPTPEKGPATQPTPVQAPAKKTVPSQSSQEPRPKKALP